MASYGTIYEFRFDDINGDDVDIFIAKKNYTGSVTRRALGRTPILKRERSGNILGTSLEIYAECRVDGEFAQLYTSSADEFRVEVYKRQNLLWTGFVSPELYSEPDIAPPYDVQIIATDGLGELKNYDFIQGSRPRSFLGHLNAMLAHTNLDLGVEAVSDLQYYDDGWSNGVLSIVVDLQHKESEDCYSVLQSLLASVNACITVQDAKWTIIRETDLYNNISRIGSVAFGSMANCEWWPIGNLSADIIPAARSLSLVSENQYRYSALLNSAMTEDASWQRELNAFYDQNERAYLLPDSGSTIRQGANFNAEVGYQLLLRISARNLGNVEAQMIGVAIKINGRLYQAGSEFWLAARAEDKEKFLWSNQESYVEFELPASSESDSRSAAKNIEIVIPLYKYDNRSYAYATAMEVTIFNSTGSGTMAVYQCSLSQYEQYKGNKIDIRIGNGAREDAGSTDLLFNDGEFAQQAAEVFRTSLPLAYSSEAIIKRWQTASIAEDSYLSVLGRDYAMQVALPRMRYRGKLNVPSLAFPRIPPLFQRDNTYYFLNTYSYDLLNSELEVELISIPNARVEIESETVTELPSSGSGSASSSGGSTGGGGTSGGGGSDIVVDASMSDTSTNPVQNKVIKAYVDKHPQYEVIEDIEVPDLPEGPQGSVDLTGYATEQWVENKGYATRSWVNGRNFATEQWVGNQGFVDKAYVGSQINAYSSNTYALIAALEERITALEKMLEGVDGASGCYFIPTGVTFADDIVSVSYDRVGVMVEPLTVKTIAKITGSIPCAKESTVSSSLANLVTMFNENDLSIVYVPGNQYTIEITVVTSDSNGTTTKKESFTFTA